MYIPENWGTASRCRLGYKIEIAHEIITNLRAPLYTQASHVDGWASIIIHISGDVDYITSYQREHPDALDVITISNGEVYHIVWGHTVPYERYIIYFDPDIFDTIFTGSPVLRDAIVSCINHKKYPLRIQLPENHKDELAEILSSVEPLLGVEEVGIQLQALPCIVRIFTLIYNVLNSTQQGSHSLPQNDLSGKAMQYINKNFKEISSLNEVAKQLHVSSDYLSKRFKKDTGVSVKDYLLDKKLNYSRHLVSLGQNVTEASIASGFANTSYFIQLYKKKFGITPGKN